MVVGVLFSGFLSGLAAALAALFFGLPLWIAVLLYPIIGTAGVVGFISLMLLREKTTDCSGAPELVSEFAAE